MLGLMNRGRRKKYPRRHKYAIGATVVFIFAGSKRIGRIIEKTWEEVGVDSKGHATYVISSGGKIYPCVGLDGSKEFGSIISFDTHEGKILRKSTNEYQEASTSERGYRHLQLPKLKDLCRKNKLKIGGSKKEVVDRLEQHYRNGV
jgi:hypothetical protein